MILLTIPICHSWIFKTIIFNILTSEKRNSIVVCQIVTTFNMGAKVDAFIAALKAMNKQMKADIVDKK